MVTVTFQKSDTASAVELILNVRLKAVGSHAGDKDFKQLALGVPVNFDIAPGVYRLNIIGFLSSGEEPFTLTLGNALFGSNGGVGGSVSLTATGPVYKNSLKVKVS